MDVSRAERTFITLRKRLDQLGYQQPLGIDSLPLVQKLFSDLVHTTESLRNAKVSAEKNEKESRNCDALLEPYKTDNARLVRENNELHLELLNLKEEKEQFARELKRHIRKLEHQASDLKFLNNQYVHKVRCLEKDSKTKSERIQQLQEKNMQAVVQTPGGKKHSIPFRRQRMQIDEHIPPPHTSAYPVSQPEDPYVADLLLLADGRIHELQEDIIKVKLDLENAHDSIKHLNTQIEERDKEIGRLNHALQGGRPHDVISLEAQNNSNEKLIAHLNLQIEYLQETNRALEQKVEGLQQKKEHANAEAVNLSLKNMELCEELTQIDDLAKRMEMDKERVLETAELQLQEAKKEVQRQHEIIEELENAITKLRKEQSEGSYEKDRLRDQLLELREQKDKMEGLVNFLEEEKSRLQDKIENTMASDKELVLELEAMRTQYGVCGRQRSPSRLDAFVKSLEEERDYYRQEAELYKRTRGPVGRELSPNRSPLRGRSVRSKAAREGFVEIELSHLVKERDDLKAALLGLERHMEDIQNNVKSLSTERDKFKALYKQAQEDLKVARGTDVTADILKLKEERNQAEVKLQQITSERDIIMERLKTAQTSAFVGGEEERRTVELENAIMSLERERAELQSQVRLLKDSRDAVEEELRSQSVALVQNAEEVVRQKAESNALRLLQEQMEQSLSDTQHRLSIKMNELHAAHQQIEKLEERIDELIEQGSKHKDDVIVLQKSISALDREKDALQDEVDQKTEKLVVLQEELSEKEKTLGDVRLTVTNLNKSVGQLQGVLHSHEREIASLRRQLDASQDELVRLKREKEIAIKENRRLQNDLATMTRENQTIQAEMEETLHKKDELKMRVHGYISEVSRIEKLMAAKEQENRDLLEQFRLTHSEMHDREQKLQHAEGLNNSIRLELLSTDTERRHLRDAVSHREREIEQHMQALKAYEAQVSSLVQGMSRLEEELHKEHEEKNALLSDLASVRELCVKLDSGKELTVRRLTSKSMDLERMAGELEDMRSEVELLKKQLASERSTVRNLEKLLSTNRQKEFQIHQTASERESELKVLRDRLALAESKTAEYSRDVSQLHGKVSQLQTERDVMRRQLTSERFERERAIQEMRKQGASLSSLNSSPVNVSSERSILQSLDHTSDKSGEKSVTFRE